MNSLGQFGSTNSLKEVARMWHRKNKESYLYMRIHMALKKKSNHPAKSYTNP